MEGLNSEQSSAVCTFVSGTKDVVVLASAGSGKTRMIVGRVKLMLESGVDPKRIIVITFSRRAAKDLIDKLGALGKGVRVGTFHSIALDLLCENGRGVIPISEDMADSFAETVLKTGKKSYTRKMLDACRFNRAIGSSANNAELNRLADQYEGRLMYDNAVDFLGMIIRGIEVANSLPAFHVLVDESQDTDDLQWKFVDALQKDATGFCVGDTKQQLYAFRGVRAEAFTERPGERHYLTETFRFGSDIASVANLVSGKISDGSKDVVTSVAEGAVEVVDMHEMIAVASSVPPDETCAVLCRYNQQVSDVKAMLSERGVQVAETVEISHKTALNLFRYLSHPESSMAHLAFISDKKASRLIPTLADKDLSTESCAIITESWMSSLDNGGTIFDVVSKLKVPDSLAESFSWWVSNYGDYRVKDAVRDFATLENTTSVTSGVRVMTFHGAKGLEFDTVCVWFPPVRRFSEDEWKAAYVAVTRPKRRLVVCGIDNPVVEMIERSSVGVVA